MKKLLLFAIALFPISKAIYAQGDGISIQLDGVGADLSGGSHYVNLYGSSPDLVGGIYEAHFIVTNNTGSDKQWKITRKKITVPSTWIDQICWPPLCYNASGDLYSTPNSGGNPAPIIVNGTHLTTTSLEAELKPRITPDLNAASYAVYRYYITDVTNGMYMDSIDLNVNFTLNTNSPKPNPVITLSPNPASEMLTISLGTNEDATLRIVDGLGKVVMTTSLYNGQKSIDVSDFKNGVYIMTIDAEGTKPVNKKLIIKH
jgi:hypothetical protein